MAEGGGKRKEKNRMHICTKHTESSCATGVSFSMRNSKDWCKELLKSCEQYAAVNYSVKWVTEGP